MLTFVHTVDHRIDSSVLPHEEKRVLRRGAAQRLDFGPPAPGLPLVILREPHPPPPVRAAVPLRVRLGHVLMALGQRLAGPDIAS